MQDRVDSSKSHPWPRCNLKVVISKTGRQQLLLHVHQGPSNVD